MAGIYIHIPFCRQKCHYCNFFSVASVKVMPQMAEAICREADMSQSYLSDQEITTIYFGGGTPSMLSPGMMGRLMETLHTNFRILPDAEITLEANPDDITSGNLQIWKTIGVNRLSIGIQSFRDKDLIYLNRVHDAGKAFQCLTMARDAGFGNLTLDLIFGIPGLRDENWLQNIEVATGLGIPHISAYALTIEPQTPLELMIRKGNAAPVDELQTVRQFELLMQTMNDKGYLHYEISNFCLPGHFARHNTAYWQGIPYLGLGPSAHSYNGHSRQWNVSGIKEYLTAINSGKIPAESETLTTDQKYSEYVMTGLRTMWGCNENEIRNRFGQKYVDYFLLHSAKWIENQCIISTDGNSILTNKGKLFADKIAADLFYEGSE